MGNQEDDAGLFLVTNDLFEFIYCMITSVTMRMLYDDSIIFDITAHNQGCEIAY